MSGLGVLSIDKLLGRGRNRINRVGVELEGGWEKLPKGHEPQHDGSVIIPELYGMVMGKPQYTIEQLRYMRNRRAMPMQVASIMPGEMVSEPMELGKVPVWIKKFYPKFVNETCGLHVHMSFLSAAHYMLLMDERYPATVVEYFKRWAEKAKLPAEHPIWNRLKGQSEYCQLVFDPDRQVRKTRKEYNHHDPRGHRYTAVNYCWGTHGTMECRLLPMMKDAELAISAVQTLLEITNASLVKLAPELKSGKLRGELVVGSMDDLIREVTHEII